VLLRCPTCRREISDPNPEARHRPFCSSRCKSIDLGRWLDEEYRISSPIIVDGMTDDELLLH